MINVNIALYYIIVLISILKLIFSILKNQKSLSFVLNNEILNQPYSFNYLKKQQILILSFLEAPMILLLICVSFIYSIINFEIPYLYILIFSYLSIISLISYITSKNSDEIIKYFVIAISAHPQKGNSIFNKFILCFSLLQAPLIIILVSVFINIINVKNYINNNLLFLGLDKILIAGSSMLLVGLAAFGTIIGIEQIVKNFAKLNKYYYESAEKSFLSLILGIGLVEAPFIFSFITSFLVLNTIFKEIIYLYSVIFFAIVFGLVSLFTAYQSGKALGNGMNLIEENSNSNKIILSMSILSQIFLDVRVLYMFILIILFFYKLNILF